MDRGDRRDQSFAVFTVKKPETRFELAVLSCRTMIPTGWEFFVG